MIKISVLSTKWATLMILLLTSLTVFGSDEDIPTDLPQPRCSEDEQRKTTKGIVFCLDHANPLFEEAYTEPYGVLSWGVVTETNEKGQLIAKDHLNYYQAEQECLKRNARMPTVEEYKVFSTYFARRIGPFIENKNLGSSLHPIYAKPWQEFMPDMNFGAFWAKSKNENDTQAYMYQGSYTKLTTTRVHKSRDHRFVNLRNLSMCVWNAEAK